MELSYNWSDDAYCANEGVDPEIFTVEKYQRATDARTKIAKRICSMCEVTTECLVDAIQTGDKGTIRGGLHPSERKNIIRFPS